MSPRKTAVPDVPKFEPNSVPLEDIPDADLGFAVPDEDQALIDRVTELATAAEVEGSFTEVKKPSRAVALRPEATDHHLMVGMARLSQMSQSDFNSTLAQMKQGRERMEQVMRDLMVDGTDYGKVPGIARPFLHQPGAEFLTNLFGFAVSFESTRIVRQVTDDPATPPFSYQTKSFVHLGDTDGPVVAEGYGESNPYEDRYHFRAPQRGCPVCGRPKLIKRVKPPAMAGKWQCPGWGDMGGCGTVFEANDPRLPTGEKEIVADADLYGLGETILLMSVKRSHVNSIRRATGTSGLFSQDDDSPSVQQQSQQASAGAGDPDPADPVVESATLGTPIAVGGKTNQVTQVQLDTLKRLSAEKGLNGAKIADLLSRLFGMDVAPTGAAASAAVKTLNADQLGQLLLTIETGALPEPEATPGFPPQDS